MSLNIRPFTGSESDYAAVIGVHNVVFPENIETVEEWRHWDANRPAYCYMDRWLAEQDGQCLGFAHAVQFSGMHHPQKYFVDVRVIPSARRRGVGGQLYDAVVGRLEGPIALRTETRQDMADGLAFLAARGFVEEMRTWESRLDVDAFDPAPFAAQAARAEANGVRITTLAEYMQVEPEYQRHIYETRVAIHHDVPRPDAYTPQPFEEWAAQYFSDPHMIPEAQFLGLYRGQIAGVSELWRSSIDKVFYTGLTGTRRDFRRMGIAMSLKLRAIAFAKSLGMREIRTGNEANNRGMLSINEALGFVKQPAWITFVKTF